jgi:hypothetical protein
MCSFKVTFDHVENELDIEGDGVSDLPYGRLWFREECHRNHF